MEQSVQVHICTCRIPALPSSGHFVLTKPLIWIHEHIDQREVIDNLTAPKVGNLSAVDINQGCRRVMRSIVSGLY